MEAPNFNTLQQLHNTWSEGFLFNKILDTKSSKVYLSDISGPYNNYATPKVDSPTKSNVEESENILLDNNHKPSLHLDEEKQKLGFVEHLIRNGYKSYGYDTWMLLQEDLLKKRWFGSKYQRNNPK